MLYYFLKQTFDIKYSEDYPPLMKTETLPPLKNKTRGSLIRAAGKLFARKGFEGTSVREICAEAKTNIAAIKYYFGDKIGLYKEVIEYGIDLGNSLFPLPEKLPEEDYQTFLCKQIEVILQKIKKTSGSKWYEQIIRQEMLLPTKGIQDTIDKKCAEHDYIMFYKTLSLIEPNATEEEIRKSTIYLMAILGFHGMLLPHLSGVISQFDKQNKMGIKNSAKSIADFVVAGLKAHVLS